MRSLGFVALLCSLAVGARAASAKVTLTGVLAQQNGAPVLKAKEKTYRLLASDDEMKETLEDKRIAGRMLQVEGNWKTPDTFQVQRFFTVHDGKLFKLTYYCYVCNITTYKPGPCECCQRPVEPREVPYDPNGIY